VKAVFEVVGIGDDYQLVGLGLFEKRVQAGLDTFGSTENCGAKFCGDGFAFVGSPAEIPGRRRQRAGNAADQIQKHLNRSGGEELGLFIGIGDDDRQSDHDVGAIESCGRAKRCAIDAKREQQRAWLEMRGESERQAKLARKTSAEIAGAEKPKRNLGVFAGVGMNALSRLWRAKIAAQLVEKFREIVARVDESTAESASGCTIAAWSAAETQVNSAGEKRFKSAELFGNGEGGVIGKHDAAGTDADGRSGVGDVTDQDGSGGTGDTINVVVLGEPKTFVAQRLGMKSQGAGAVECLLGDSAAA